MKKYLFYPVLAIALLCAGCTEPIKQSEVGPDSLTAATSENYREELSFFLSTRAFDPLDKTVWMADSDEEFHRMLLFSDGCVNLFYGLIENDEMQRWSDYFSAPYVLSDDGSMVTTELVYPVYGKRELSEGLTVVMCEDCFTIVAGQDTYEYVGGYTTDLDERWTLVFTVIEPWAAE